MGFGSRSRVKLDFSSPKKSEAASAPPTTTTTQPNTAVTTPINVEENNTINQSPGINVTVHTTNIEGPGSDQLPSSISGNSQSQKSGVKNSNKKFKGSKRNRIVTFDEQQLNQSGSFSSIPIKDLIVLAQQQVDSFKSPKKDTVPFSSLSPQSSPPQLYPQSSHKISGVTAITIPSDKTTVSTIVTTVPTSFVVTTTTAGVSSLDQQEMGGAGSSSDGGNTHMEFPTTMSTHTITATVTTCITTTTPAVMSVPITTTASATTYINTTRCCSILNFVFEKIFSLVFNKTLTLYHHHHLFKPDQLKLFSNDPPDQSQTR